MLKMSMGGLRKSDNKPMTVVVLGLSHKNLKKLKEGFPIPIKGEDVGLSEDIEILIFSGETEQTMAREVHDLIGPNTKTKIDPRLLD